MRRIRYHLKASPFLPSIEQSAWQRGYNDVPRWTKQKPIVAELLLAAAGTGFGLTLGTGLLERGLFAALFAAAFVLIGLIALWLFHVATAPSRQRDEARRYALALEKRVADFREWAIRQQIAQEFYESEFQRADTVEYELRHFDIAQQGEHWRERLENIEGQLRGRGGGDRYAEMVANHIRIFEAKDDGYGDDELRRLQWAIRNAAQELRGIVRREEQPPSPARPGESAS